MPGLVTSPRNKQVQSATRLRKRAFRERDRRFLAEGAQAVREALAAGAVEVVFHVPGERGGTHPEAERAQREGVRTVAVSEAVMGHLQSTVTPQGVLAVARFVDVPLRELPSRPALVPVLVAVRDPGNAGTVLRSADAAGADAIVFTGSSVDVYNPKTVRASAGSLFHLPLVRDVPVDEAVGALRARGMRVLAADAKGEASVYETDLSVPTAVLFGNEAWGLPEEAVRLSDASVRVPIRGRAESLNLAAAAALVLFEAARQGAGAGAPAAGDGLAAAVASAAHDVRSPLAALRGLASTLAARGDDLPPADRAAVAGGLWAEAERATAVVKLLVDAARVEAGRFHPSPAPGEVADDARKVAAAFARSPDHPDVVVDGTARAVYDPDRLQPILLVLIEQAAWWGGEGPVEAVLRHGPDAVEVVVRRRGGRPSTAGPRDVLEHPSRGGKVGPYLARRVAEASGWELSSEGGGGIAFRLVLPPA